MCVFYYCSNPNPPTTRITSTWMTSAPVGLIHISVYKFTKSVYWTLLDCVVHLGEEVPRVWSPSCNLLFSLFSFTQKCIYNSFDVDLQLFTCKVVNTVCTINVQRHTIQNSSLFTISTVTTSHCISKGLKKGPSVSQCDLGCTFVKTRFAMDNFRQTHKS